MTRHARCRDESKTNCRQKFSPHSQFVQACSVPQAFLAMRFQSSNRLSSRPLRGSAKLARLSLAAVGRLRSSKMAARNYCRHLRAALAGLNFQPPAELFHSFFHSYNSYPSSFVHGGAVQHSVRYAPPMIANRNCQSVGDVLDLDVGFVASRMQVTKIPARYCLKRTARIDQSNDHNNCQRKPSGVHQRVEENAEGLSDPPAVTPSAALVSHRRARRVPPAATTRRPRPSAARTQRGPRAKRPAS